MNNQGGSEQGGWMVKEYNHQLTITGPACGMIFCMLNTTIIITIIIAKLVLKNGNPFFFL